MLLFKTLPKGMLPFKTLPLAGLIKI